MKPRAKTTLLTWLMALLLASNIVPLTAFASSDAQGEAVSAEAFAPSEGEDAVSYGEKAAPAGNAVFDEALEFGGSGDSDGTQLSGAERPDDAQGAGTDRPDGPSSGEPGPNALANYASESDGFASAAHSDDASAKEASAASAFEPRADEVDIKTLWPAGTPDEDRTIVKGMTLGFSDAQGKPLPAGQNPTIDSIVHLAFPLSIPSSVTDQIKQGDYYAFELPDTISIATGIHQVALSDPGNPDVVYANFEVTPSRPGTPATVTITFTDAIRGQGDVSGEMRFSGGLNGETIGKPGETVIKLPFEQTVPPTTITIAPAVDDDVSKSGAFDQPTNPSMITWTVDVNKGLKQMTDGSVTEVFPQGLVYTGVEVYQVPVDFYGNVVGAPGDAGWTELSASDFTASGDGATVALNAPYDSTSQAFRFVYRTSIQDDVKPSVGGDMTFTNTATAHSQEAGGEGLPAQATVSAHFGKVLDKNGATYDPASRTITWKVQYNYGEHHIPADEAWIDDICDYPDLEYVDGSVTVQKMRFENGAAVVDSPLSEGGGAGEYAFANDAANHRVSVSFNDDVDYPVLVTYKTKVTSIVDANKTYVNTALTHGTPPPVAHDSITIGQHNIAKRVIGVDLDAKTITWQIDINESRYEMRNFTLTDTLVLGLSHTLANSADVDVYDATANAPVPEATSPTGDGYALDMATDADGNHVGFNLAFHGSYGDTDHAFRITYKTEYDAMRNPPDGSQEFVNQASSLWLGADGGAHSNNYTARYRPTPPDGSNGSKSGSYNAVDKTITWTVLVDYARTGLLNASIADAILPGQTFIDDSLTVYSYSILSNGKVVRGPELSPEEMAKLDVDLPNEGNGEMLTVGFPDGNGLYGIEFKTSVAGTVIAKTYDNTAVFHNEAQTVSDTSLKAEVSVKHGGSLVEKSGYQDSDGYASWSLTVNPSNSTLENVLVTDTPSTNQAVDLDSVVINGTTVDADGTLTVDPATELVEGEDYTVAYAQNDAGVWQLTVAFTHAIERAYVMTYRATLYADSSVPISAATNAAKVTGTNVEEATDTTTGSILVQLNDGAGILKGVRKDLLVHKTDGNGNDLAGAKFQLYNSNGQPVGGIAVTDAQGAISYQGIVTGAYTLKEVEPAPGYTMTEELASGIPLVLEADSGAFEVQNELTEVSFTKQNAEGDPVGGARFALERLDGTDWAAVSDLPVPLDLESGDDGAVIIQGLAPGHYRLSEVAAPYPYVLGDPVEFDVAYRSDAVSVVDPVVLPAYVNERFAGVLSLLKTDDRGNPLAGARFALKSADGTVVDDAIATGSDGRASVRGLAEGSYVLTETQAPEGYELDTAEHAFDVVYNETGQTIELTLVNEAAAAPPDTPVPLEPKPLEPSEPPAKDAMPKAAALAATGDGNSVFGALSLAALAGAVLLGAGAGLLARKKNMSAPKN